MNKINIYLFRIGKGGVVSDVEKLCSTEYIATLLAQ